MNSLVEHSTASRASGALMPVSAAAGHASTSRTLPREFLSFRLGGEEYGIDILTVQEIRSYEAPTRIANAPSFVLGVVNLRGVIVPILDLRLKLGCASAEYNDFTVVIVLTVMDRVIGVVVDSVSDVLEIAPNNIKPAPTLSSAVDSGHILGMGCLGSGDDQRLLILTDIQAMLMSPEMGLFNTPELLSD